MLDAGLLAEAELVWNNRSRFRTAAQAIGYKEAVAAVRGEASPQDAVAAIQLASRRYAKRQLTWLRRDPSIHWFYWKKTRILPDCLAFSTEILHTYGVS